MSSLSSIRKLSYMARTARWALAADDPWAATSIKPNSATQRNAVNDEHREVLISGGKRSGKTETGAHRLLKVLARDDGQIANVLRKTFPDLAGTTGEMVAFVLWRLVNPKIKPAQCPFESLKRLPADIAIWREKPLNHILLPRSNARCYFRHLQTAEAFGSYERGLIWPDEVSELDHDDYKEMRARITQPGATQQLFMTTNPPRVAEHWLEKEFLGKLPAYKVVYELSMLDNRENLGEAFIAGFDDLPENERRWLVEGRLGSVFGTGTRVFPEFRRVLHVAKAPLEPFEGRAIIRGWDIQPVSKHLACAAHSIGPGGKVRTLREWEAEGQAIADFGWEVQADCVNLWGRDFAFGDGIDPAAYTKSYTDGRNAVEVLMTVGIEATGAQISQTGRREYIGQLLSRLIGGEPAIEYDPSCRKLIGALDGGYTLDDLKGSYSHIVDAHGYGLTAPMAARTARQASITIPRPRYQFGSQPAHGGLVVVQDGKSDGFGRLIR